MNLIHHVSAVKNLIARGIPSDDFAFSDRLIAHFLGITRAKLIEQKIDKYHFISEQSYQSLCVSLEKSNFHNCCQEGDNDCQILKSVDEIPKFLNSRWGNFLKVMDLEGRVIPEISLTQSRFAEYALAPRIAGWFMHDNHIYVVHNKVIETILLNALFDDPAQIHELNCPTTGENCNDFMSEQFPIDPDLTDAMYKLTLEYLLKSYQLPNDIENNAKDVQLSEGIQ